MFTRSTFIFKNIYAAVFLSPPLPLGSGFPVGVSLSSPSLTRGLQKVGRALLGKTDLGLVQGGTSGSKKVGLGQPSRNFFKKVLNLLEREGCLVTTPWMMMSVSQAKRDQAVECSFVSLIHLLIRFPQRPQLFVGRRA